jgi:uncharacterized protein (DUF1499 family)
MKMKGRKMWVVLIVAGVIGLMAYVRLAPSDPAIWHVDVPRLEDKDFAGGVIRVIDGDAATLESLTHIAEADGAQPFAGDLASGHLTYISRSKIVAFPDYTTLQLKDGKIAIYGRLRFGKSDTGVNRRRVSQWLAQL